MREKHNGARGNDELGDETEEQARSRYEPNGPRTPTQIQHGRDERKIEVGWRCNDDADKRTKLVTPRGPPPAAVSRVCESRARL